MRNDRENVRNDTLGMRKYRWFGLLEGCPN